MAHARSNYHEYMDEELKEPKTPEQVAALEKRRLVRLVCASARSGRGGMNWHE